MKRSAGTWGFQSRGLSCDVPVWKLFGPFFYIFEHSPTFPSYTKYPARYTKNPFYPSFSCPTCSPNTSYQSNMTFTHPVPPLVHPSFPTSPPPPIQSSSFPSCPCPTCAIHQVPPVLHPVDETDEVLAVGLEVVAEDAAVLLLHEHDLKVG